MRAVNVGSAYSVQPGTAEHGPLEDYSNPAWLVTSFRRFRPLGVNKLFGHLAVVRFSIECPLNFILKKLVAVGGNLERCLYTQFQVLHVFFNREGSAFANHPIDDELAVRVHAEKNGLPPTLRVFRPIVLFLAADEAKKFVNLDERKSDMAHTLIEEEGAFTSCHFQNRLNRVLMRSSEARRGADTHAFDHKVDDLRDPSKRRFEPA